MNTIQQLKHELNKLGYVIEWNETAFYGPRYEIFENPSKIIVGCYYHDIHKLILYVRMFEPEKLTQILLLYSDCDVKNLTLNFWEKHTFFEVLKKLKNLDVLTFYDQQYKDVCSITHVENIFDMNIKEIYLSGKFSNTTKEVIQLYRDITGCGFYNEL